MEAVISQVVTAEAAIAEVVIAAAYASVFSEAFARSFADASPEDDIIIYSILSLLDFYSINNRNNHNYSLNYKLI